ncbi:MAG: tetratricopeptide repeat protein [Bacteroidota bacterium]
MITKIVNAGLIFLFLSFSLHSFSQDDSIDSLKEQLESLQGTKKIETYNAISKAFWEIAPDSSLYYSKKALTLAKEMNDKASISDAYNRIGNAFFYMGIKDSTLSYYNKSLEIRKDIEDKERLVQVYHNFALYYRNEGNDEKAINYYKKAHQAAKDGGLTDEIFFYSYTLNNLYIDQNNYKKAVELLLKTIDVAKETGDSLEIANINNRIGNIYESITSYDKALEYYLEALKIWEEKEVLRGMAISYNSIGIIHERLKNYDKALEYYNKTLDIYKQLDEESGMGMVYNNLGIIYDEKNQRDTALKYYQKSYDIDQELNDTSGMSTSLNNIGLVYFEQDKNQKALEFLNRSLKYSKLMDDEYSIANTQNNIAEVLVDESRYDEASRKLQMALSTAKEINAREIEEESYMIYSKLYEALGDYKKSLQYHKQQTKLHDSIFSQEKQNKIQELQVKQETEQKEKEIQLLKELHKLEISKQKTFRNFSIALVALLIVMIVLIYSRFSLKKKSSKMLEAKNKQLQQANEKLKRSKDNLRELNATKDKFFSIISHDLKNPFQALFGFSEALYKDLDKFSREEIQEYSKLIYESTQSLYNLLQNLLQWSRSQLGSIRISPAKIKVIHTVKDIINLLKINANEKQISFDNKISEELEVFVDEQVLSTVLRNLLSNAIKFTPSGGTVTISGEEKNNEVIITVSDTGQGISKEEEEKLFAIDKNLPKSGTEKEKGTGLGLILCKELLEYSNGKIWAEISNKGGIFRFSLPKEQT